MNQTPLHKQGKFKDVLGRFQAHVDHPWKIKENEANSGQVLNKSRARVQILVHCDQNLPPPYLGAWARAGLPVGATSLWAMGVPLASMLFLPGFFLNIDIDITITTNININTYTSKTF